jgi:hypothetical protein
MHVRRVGRSQRRKRVHELAELSMSERDPVSGARARRKHLAECDIVHGTIRTGRAGSARVRHCGSTGTGTDTGAGTASRNDALDNVRRTPRSQRQCRVHGGRLGATQARKEVQRPEPDQGIDQGNDRRQRIERRRERWYVQPGRSGEGRE